MPEARLMTHLDGWEATRADLAAVSVPAASPSHCPVPYTRLVEELYIQLPRFGFTVAKERYALRGKDSQQMFGVLTCVNGHNQPDYAMALGLRTSLDKSLAIGLAAGSNVFVCDNLAFNGEITLHRKSTPNVMRDLPDMIYSMLNKVQSVRDRTDAEILALKDCQLDARAADHLMVKAIRANVMPASRLPLLMEAWEHPTHPEFEPRTAWSLFNSFTEVHKLASPALQIEGSLRLSNLFRTELNLVEPSLPEPLTDPAVTTTT